MIGAKHCRTVLVLIFAMSLIACTGTQPEGPFTEREVQELRHRAGPNDGRLVTASQLMRNDFGLRATWDVETSSDNHAYFQWLKGQLAPEYHVTVDGASTIAFAKETRGDSYSLAFTSNKISNRAVTRATFIALAD
jgi:hypothetical protein